jgi:lipoprotein-releasing system ATP-binding protein
MSVALGSAAKVPLIEARKVTRILPGIVPTTLVQNVDLSVGENEFVAITGPSGSGKSSLLYLLGLLDLPTTGEVLIRGRDTSHMDEEERAFARLSLLGFVFQFHFLLPEFTVLDNVLLPMRALGRDSSDAMRTRARDLLGSLDSKASEQVFGVLRDIVDKHGKTVVAVTHDLGLAERMDRHIELLDGRIVGDEQHQISGVS